MTKGQQQCFKFIHTVYGVNFMSYVEQMRVQGVPNKSSGTQITK